MAAGLDLVRRRFRHRALAGGAVQAAAQRPGFASRAVLVLGVGALLTGLYFSAVRSSTGAQGGSVLTSPSALIQDAKGAVEQMNLRQKQQEEELRRIQTEK